jgi:hypothetical protein
MDDESIDVVLSLLQVSGSLDAVCIDLPVI